MKTFLFSLLLAAAVLAVPAVAQTNLAGTWQGSLEAAPGKTLTIQFVIAAKSGGGYSAIVTSPDTGAIKDVPAATVTFANSKLALDVPALSGSYAGTLRNGALEGEWAQEGKKLPLSLRPYQAPTLTRADIDALRGEWVGALKPPGNEVKVVFRFNTGADGALHAAVDLPERHVRGLPAADIALDDGHFSLKVPVAKIEVRGELKGDEITGQWTDPSITTPLAVKKGHYAEAVIYLDLPAQAREQLKGRWTGTLNNLAVVVRFETDAQGRTVGTFDSTQQFMSFPIKEAELAGSKLTFGVSYGAKFAGEIAGGKMTGEWAQANLPKPLPIALTREK
jgi:hypothetical protein